jgi:hypothetical protein
METDMAAPTTPRGSAALVALRDARAALRKARRASERAETNKLAAIRKADEAAALVLALRDTVADLKERAGLRVTPHGVPRWLAEQKTQGVPKARKKAVADQPLRAS